MDLLAALLAARKVSTPLIAIRTPDPAATETAFAGQYPDDQVIVSSPRRSTYRRTA